MYTFKSKFHLFTDFLNLDVNYQNTGSGKGFLVKLDFKITVFAFAFF